MNAQDKRLSWQIAEWASNIEAKNIPNDILKRAKHCIADTIGVAIAGSQSHAAIAAREISCRKDSLGRSTVFGFDQPSSSRAAAFANGTSAHVFDFDDNCYAGFVHGSAIIGPAVLAAGQEVNATGEETLAAFVVGAECEYAVGAATRNVLYDRGWWSSGILGPIGSSMAAARILGLNTVQTHAALGLALVNASGIKACFGSDAKALMAGRASELGIICAELAAKGVSGPKHPFSDVYGFINLFNNGDFDEACLTALGKHWYMADPGVDTKRIPVCLSSHASVDAALEIVEKHHIDPAQIKHIVCDVPPIVRANLKYNLPSTPQEAQFSMPFAIAASLRFPALSLSLLHESTLKDKALIDLMARITMETSPIWNEEDRLRSAPEGGKVRIELHNGKFHEAFKAKSVGSADHPLSPSQMADKFLACTEPVLGSERAKGLWSRLEHIDTSTALRNILANACHDTFT